MFVEYFVSGFDVKICPVLSDEYKNRLRHVFLSSNDDFPPKTTIDQVIDYLAVEKLKVGKKTKVFLRFGRDGSTYYIDQSNQAKTAIEFDQTGWQIKYKYSLPIKFRTLTTLRPIVDPNRDGDAFDLFKYLPFNEESQKILALVCLCSMPMRNFVRPIIGLQGAEGSGKTTVGRIFRAVFDHCYPDILTFKKKEDEFALVLYHNAVPVFDNLSRLPNHIVDMFCRATTGEGFSKRQLYTDDRLTSFGYKRPLIYTGLESPSNAADFLDRRVLFELHRLSMTDRKEESMLWEGFNQDLPSILGGCLDLIVEALKILPTLKLERLPRLADFAKFGTAICMALGYSQNYFVNILNENVNAKKLEAAIQEEPIIEALLKFTKDNKKWSGLSSDLFKILNQQYQPTAKSNWPPSAEAFGKKLSNQKIQSLLSDNQVDIIRNRSRSGNYCNSQFI